MTKNRPTLPEALEIPIQRARKTRRPRLPRRIRDREAPGSNPGPPTSSDFKWACFGQIRVAGYPKWGRDVDADGMIAMFGVTSTRRGFISLPAPFDEGNTPYSSSLTLKRI